MINRFIYLAASRLVSSRRGCVDGTMGGKWKLEKWCVRHGKKERVVTFGTAKYTGLWWGIFPRDTETQSLNLDRAKGNKRGEGREKTRSFARERLFGTRWFDLRPLTPPPLLFSTRSRHHPRALCTRTFSAHATTVIEGCNRGLGKTTRLLGKGVLYDLLSRHARILSKLCDSEGEGREEEGSYRVLHEAASHRPSLPVSSLRSLAEEEITTPFHALVFAFIRASSSVTIYHFNIEFYTRRKLWCLRGDNQYQHLGKQNKTDAERELTSRITHCTCFIFIFVRILYLRNFSAYL